MIGNGKWSFVADISEIEHFGIYNKSIIKLFFIHIYEEVVYKKTQDKDTIFLLLFG